MRINWCALANGCLLLLSACGRSREADPLANAVASSSSRRVTAPPAENPRDIGALFQVEAEHRPSSNLSVEKTFAGLRAAGLTVSSERQHLARPYGARYCVGARTGSTIALSVCEYVDEAAAQAGAAVSRKIPLKDRVIRQNGGTTLTVRLLENNDASRALQQRIDDVFAKL